MAILRPKRRIINDPTRTGIARPPRGITERVLQIHKQRNSRKKVLPDIVPFSLNRFTEGGNLRAATDKSARLSVFAAKKYRSAFRVDDRCIFGPQSCHSTPTSDTHANTQTAKRT